MSTKQHIDLNRDGAVHSGANKKHLRPSVIAILVTFLALFSPKPASAEAGSEAEMEKIRTMIKKYEKSVTDADTRLASEIWSLSKDASFIHPQGHEHGWDEIKRNVYEKLMRDAFSERKLSTSDISFHIYEDAAWAEFNWVFVAKLRSNGSPVRTKRRETQVYQKTDRGWRLVHVHYSGMPVAPKSEGFSEATNSTTLAELSPPPPPGTTTAAQTVGATMSSSATRTARTTSLRIMVTATW